MYVCFTRREGRNNKQALLTLYHRHHFCFHLYHNTVSSVVCVPILQMEKLWLSEVE